MAKRLSKQLEEHGCQIPAEQFKDFLQTELPKHYEWSVDELVLHPNEAQLFCNAVRNSNPEYANLPDDLILRTMMGRRKRPVRVKKVSI